MTYMDKLRDIRAKASVILDQKSDPRLDELLAELITTVDAALVSRALSESVNTDPDPPAADDAKRS